MKTLWNLVVRWRQRRQARRNDAGFEGIVDRVDLDARLRARGLGGL
jgi:hypothetical protein